MQQAYVHFNAGKFKEALNSLAGCTPNTDSYEPNLAICEYLSNRCTQSALICIKRLNEILNRKIKRDSRLESQTEVIIRFNLAVLLILMGKRDTATLVLEAIYRSRDSLIEFMQSRVFFLTLQLNMALKNSFQVLEMYRGYLLKPVEQSQQLSQWISVILHEHSRAHSVSREEFIFMSKMLLNQSFMQLDLPSEYLSSAEDDENALGELLERIKKRKNTFSKYYEINVAMIDRFLCAQKQFYSRNYARCLSQMNFVNIVNQFEEMPSNKIITNILNAFATSNTGLTHFALGKTVLALHHFVKAKTLLSKACTGVEDKDLQLFSINYANHSDSISFNTALALLASKPAHSFSFFEAIKKSNPKSKNYKFWYRVGQAYLEYIQATRLPNEHRRALFFEALHCFTNSLLCLQSFRIPNSSELSKTLPMLSEDDMQQLTLNLSCQVSRFRQSVVCILCYINLSLCHFQRVIKQGNSALGDRNMTKETRLNILHYIAEAYAHVNRSEDLMRTIEIIKQETDFESRETHSAVYASHNGDNIESVEEQTEQSLFEHLTTFGQSREGNLKAVTQIGWHICTSGISVSPSAKAIVKYNYLHKLVSPKLARPYLLANEDDQ